MTTTFTLMRGTALAAVLSLPVAAVPAIAQETQGDQPQVPQGEALQEQAEPFPEPQAEGGEQPDEPVLQGEQMQEQAEPSGDQPMQAEGADPQADNLVATVGDAEIRNSDVASAIGALPEPLRDQPPDVLVPIAVDQLVLRELILQEARTENLQEDPEVQSLSEEAAQPTPDDAMVQVWLQRELGDRLTDEAVQETYDEFKSSAPADETVPDLQQVRPQIEQHLAQQAMSEIRTDLSEKTEVVFFGPDGEPLEAEDGQEGGDGGQG